MSTPVTLTYPMQALLEKAPATFDRMPVSPKNRTLKALRRRGLVQVKRNVGKVARLHPYELVWRRAGVAI